MAKEIYISYAWGDSAEVGESREAIVNEIYSTFKSRGLNIKLDKKDVHYKASIKEFEERMGRGDCIILVISDKFLKSEHCMFEVLKIKENGNLNSRIFPILLSDAKIYDEVNRIDYINYWDNKIDELNEKVKTIKYPSGTTTVIAKVDQLVEIRKIIADVSNLFRDMNTLSIEYLKENDFKILVESIEKELGIDNPTNNIKNTSNGKDGRINSIYKQLSIPKDVVDIGDLNDIKEYSPETLDKIIRQLTNVLDTHLKELSNDLEDTYENSLKKNQHNMKDEYIKSMLINAGVCLKAHQFDKALVSFQSALEKINYEDVNYNLIYKEYLVTGYILYSKMNDMEKMRTLLANNRLKFDNQQIDNVIADIFQEISTREIDIDGLKKSADIIENSYSTASRQLKPNICNSLGLAYRRIGERNNPDYLKKSIEILNEGISLNPKLELFLKLKNNLAIALIRTFEQTKVESYLQNAENILLECKDFLDKIEDPREYALKPMILNNLGNIFKQKCLILNDIPSAAKAVSYYEEATKVWTEKDACYEWAMIEKNIGETKFAIAQITKDLKTFINALNHCIRSIKYRNYRNSPFQYVKSVDVIFLIVIALKKYNSLSKITEKNRKSIQGCIALVEKNKNELRKMGYNSFIKKAQKVSLILNTV